MPMTKVKKERLEAIGDLITERRSIGSQAELVDLLQERGFKVTQSSVSRDLQDLGVKRVNGRYVLKPWRQVGAGDFDGLVGFVHQATRTGPNLTVIVTSPNAAKMVAEAIHSAAWPEVVGIVTGDDTLFVATLNEEDQTTLFDRLSQYLKRN